MKINLAPFCWSGPDDCRYPGMRKPFRIGKWAYASDGRILVRIPATTEKKSAEKVPHVNDLFRKFRVASCAEPWPECEGDIKRGGIWIPPQTVSCRKIAGVYWLRIAVLGQVFFNPGGEQNDIIQFVSGELQGLIMPWGEDE